jgi:hypothetical protein
MFLSLYMLIEVPPSVFEFPCCPFCSLLAQWHRRFDHFPKKNSAPATGGSAGWVSGLLPIDTGDWNR